MQARHRRWIFIFLLIMLVPSTLSATAIPDLPPEFSDHGPTSVLEIHDPAMEASVWRETNRNVEQLHNNGVLASPNSPQRVSFSWPLRYVGSNPSIFNYYAIRFFFDHDPDPGQLRDYSGGQRTYDTSSYDHNGMDVELWPFHVRMMDSEVVQVIAAAAGTIVYRADGNYDRNCAWQSGAVNMVNIRHADGSISRYAHLKKGSVTAKKVGDTIAQGEYIGLVGSSGNSALPHLHFDVYINNTTSIDPFQGPSNPSVPISWWASQRPYWNSALNRLMTSTQYPVTDTCPSPEITYEAFRFDLGSTVRFMAYYSDQRSSQSTVYTVKRPNGTVFATWNHSRPADYPMAQWGWSQQIPANEQAGRWTFNVTYLNQTYTHAFYMGPLNYKAHVPYIRR